MQIDPHSDRVCSEHTLFLSSSLDSKASEGGDVTLKSIVESDLVFLPVPRHR